MIIDTTSPRHTPEDLHRMRKRKHRGKYPKRGFQQSH
jgi:hypothetical protein